MMTVNNERVWVPRDRANLIAGLRRMGILKIAGIPLSKASIKELTMEYCRVRSLITRRRQKVRVPATPISQSPKPSTCTQLSLFSAKE